MSVKRTLDPGSRTTRLGNIIFFFLRRVYYAVLFAIRWLEIRGGGALVRACLHVFVENFPGVIPRYILIFIDVLSLILHFTSLDSSRKTMEYAFNVRDACREFICTDQTNIVVCDKTVLKLVRCIRVHFSKC